jgi:hypothetical protein
MWLFWNIPVNTPAYDELIYHRWNIILYSIAGASMAIVLVRTYNHCKYPYIYTCAALMFMSGVFEVLANILFNYAENEKFHGEPTNNWVANLLLF